MIQISEGTARNGDIELPWIRTGTGSGEPLLLVNGLSSPRVSYEDGLVAEFNNLGFDVVRFDNRDAGRATSTNGGYLLADQADDAIAVIDAVGWNTAHVFGMSMGGMIVQQLGIDHASRLRSITSLMSSTGNPKFGSATKEAQAALLTPSPTEREAWIDQRVATEQIWASPDHWTEAGSRAKSALMFDYGVQPRRTVHQFKAMVKSPRREDALREVHVPTLVMHGTADTLITPPGGVRTAEIMPNATFVALEGMGHDLPEFYWPIIAGHVGDLAGSID
ncbi:MAG: alpha/beta fold hydrolase [Acidimicrobiales bacterium]|jgi:pimeloyl-ACP methyl ester carboxylesterase